MWYKYSFFLLFTFYFCLVVLGLAEKFHVENRFVNLSPFPYLQPLLSVLG
ncbi:hypothetical protein FDUTEX481_08149 [Tolypothrix sp. PCC 7601]|nr:hypothetical protein FDUTEX481_08149 [Tolypothrix sp. PCC 7601]